MALNEYTRDLLRSKIEVDYEAGKVVIPTATLDVEGIVNEGASLTIVTAGEVTISDYNGESFTSENVDVVATKLVIDQKKVTAQRIEKVEAKQAAGTLEPLVARQGVKHRETQEEFALRTLINEGTRVNVTGSAPVTVDTAAKAKTAVLKLAGVFDANKVPTTGRILFVNGAFKTLLIESMSDASVAGGDTELRKGTIGELYGFNIILSNDFTEKTKPVAVATADGSWAYAAQFDEDLQTLPVPGTFKTEFAMLSVYGAKVVHPKGVASFVSGGQEPAPVVEDEDGE